MSEIERAPDSQTAIDNKPETVSEEEHAELVAAVAQAMEQAPVEPPKAEPPKVQAKPEPAPPKEGEPPPAEENIPELTKRIRARVETHEQKAQAEAQRIRDEAQTAARSEAERIIREAREQVERERHAWSQSWQKSPIEALRAQGIDPNTLVNEVVKEGTPEWQMLKAQQKALDDLRAEQSKYGEWRKEQEERDKRYAEMEAMQRRQSTVQTYLSEANPERAPNLRAWAEEMHKASGGIIPHMRNPDDWLVIAGDHAHAQAMQANGQVANISDLVQHLEYIAAQRQAAATPAQGQSPGKVAESLPAANGARPQRATGPRTLSNATNGERRAAAPRPSQLDDDDLHSSMVAGVAEAMRAGRAR